MGFIVHIVGSIKLYVVNAINKNLIRFLINIGLSCWLPEVAVNTPSNIYFKKKAYPYDPYSTIWAHISVLPVSIPLYAFVAVNAFLIESFTGSILVT